MPEKNRVRIRLTKEQREDVERVIGLQTEGIELAVEELEERMAPSFVLPDGTKFTARCFC